MSSKRYMTKESYHVLQQELTQLLHRDRPAIVETVRWAALNGDRSENADYIYGKRKLREIDRRIRYLTIQLDNAVVIDNSTQPRDCIFFGAQVTYHELDTHTTNIVTIVGEDEANPQIGKISYLSPLARAMFKHTIGDDICVHTPQGERYITIENIEYKEE